jgi:uncharacterized surface protein with fasciclin (FAS1) repeats
MSTILQIAGADKNLITLMKGFKAADMEDILSKNGAFTIFAPVNLAFSKLASDPFEDLLNPGNKIKLSSVLNYHLLSTKKMLKDFRNGQKLTTVNGQEVLVTIKDGDVHINGAKILARDKQASNGVIHSIDAVNIPAWPVPSTETVKAV